MLPKGIALDSVEVWFQDEHRFGQRGTLSRIWAEKGRRPRVVRQQQFNAAYLFGAVCPQEDKAVALVMPYANSEAMQYHLNSISEAIADDKHAVILMDRAGWHLSKELRWPKNISALHLPAYSPELNAQEQVGQQLRRQYLSNRCFRDYQEIIEAVSIAWNSFVSTAKNVQNLCYTKSQKV